MQFPFSSRRFQWSWASLLGVLCIALVLIAGVVQVTHVHASGQMDPDCSLCVTAHHVVQVVALVTVEFTSQPVAPLAPEKALPLPRQRFLQKLAIRPPPVVSAFA